MTLEELPDPEKLPDDNLDLAAARINRLEGAYFAGAPSSFDNRSATRLSSETLNSVS